MPAPTAAGDADRWRKVLNRDRTADGTFVYAVASTGIFCRPSCPSRRPHRDRVRFSTTPAAGYGSISRFYERAAPKRGMAPSRYHAGAGGETIRYATEVLPIGVVLLAATTRGICTVSLGESAGRLVADMRAEFPEAALEPGADDLRAWASRIVAQAAGNPQPLDLPLDIRATAFQWRVWTALAAIPRGGTRTYTEVAESIGHPTSARAVARACAANPVALVIPCHRVVPARGGTGGYRWGATRKQALLAAESAHAREAAEGARPPAGVRSNRATPRGRIAGHEPR